MNAPSLSVVLATYNGAKYLPAQLESLWKQTFYDFIVLVRDDGSSDTTRDILQAAAGKWGDRLQILSDSDQRLGPSRSFSRLMECTTTPYVAFCDQDDYWLPEKLERLVAAIRRIEGFDGATAALACSDVVVADSNLQALQPSYFAKHNFSVVDGRDLGLNRLIFRNYAIGATTIVNRRLIRECGTIPDKAVMHDWWLALLATCIGEVAVINQPLMLYRQHGTNAVGSQTHRVPRSLAQIEEYVRRARKGVLDCAAQVEALANKHGDQMTKAQLETLRSFSCFASNSALGRYRAVVKNRAFKPGALLNALHLFACATAGEHASHP